MRCLIVVFATLCVGAPIHAGAWSGGSDPDKTTVTGTRLTLEEHTDELCSNSTLHAKSDGTKIELEGTSYPMKDFGAALARRYKTAHYYCVEIVGPGQDAQLVSSYLKALAGTDVTSIGWRVEAQEAGHDAAHP